MPKDDLQVPLFEVGEPWHEHWKQMPEFSQPDAMPYKTIFVHFENRADMEAFSQLVEQKIGLSTKSIWYPEAEIQHWDKKWVDSEPDEEIPSGPDFEVIDEE